MSTYYDKPEFDFDNSINTDIDTDIDFDTNINLNITKNVDVDMNVNTNIEGNTAILVADVQAIGTNTFVQVDTSVLAVEDKMSSITISAIAVVG